MISETQQMFNAAKNEMQLGNLQIAFEQFNNILKIVESSDKHTELLELENQKLITFSKLYLTVLCYQLNMLDQVDVYYNGLIDQWENLTDKTDNEKFIFAEQHHLLADLCDQMNESSDSQENNNERNFQKQNLFTDDSDSIQLIQAYFKQAIHNYNSIQDKNNEHYLSFAKCEVDTANFYIRESYFNASLLHYRSAINYLEKINSESKEKLQFLTDCYKTILFECSNVLDIKDICEYANKLLNLSIENYATNEDYLDSIACICRMLASTLALKNKIEAAKWHYCFLKLAVANSYIFNKYKTVLKSDLSDANQLLNTTQTGEKKFKKENLIEILAITLYTELHEQNFIYEIYKSLASLEKENSKLQLLYQFAYNVFENINNAEPQTAISIEFFLSKCKNYNPGQINSSERKLFIEFLDFLALFTRIIKTQQLVSKPFTQSFAAYAEDFFKFFSSIQEKIKEHEIYHSAFQNEKKVDCLKHVMQEISEINQTILHQITINQQNLIQNSGQNLLFPIRQQSSSTLQPMNPTVQNMYFQNN